MATSADFERLRQEAPVDLAVLAVSHHRPLCTLLLTPKPLSCLCRAWVRRLRIGSRFEIRGAPAFLLLPLPDGCVGHAAVVRRTSELGQEEFTDPIQKAGQIKASSTYGYTPTAPVLLELHPNSSAKALKTAKWFLG